MFPSALRSSDERGMPKDRAAFIDANINPDTKLAHDYLNHFNEAIMVLELMATMPEALEHFLAWRPKTYCEHFNASRLKHRAFAVAAYEAADSRARRQLDELSAAMNGILVSLRETLRMNLSQPVAIPLATAAATHLKQMVGLAGAVINGGGVDDLDEATDSAQSAIDALLDQ